MDFKCFQALAHMYEALDAMKTVVSPAPSPSPWRQIPLNLFLDRVAEVRAYQAARAVPRSDSGLANPGFSWCLQALVGPVKSLFWRCCDSRLGGGRF